MAAGANTTVSVSANGTTCEAGGCTYAWLLACPAGDVTYGQEAWNITAGPGGDIDTTALAPGDALTCNLTLTVTDTNGANSTATTEVTVV